MTNVIDLKMGNTSITMINHDTVPLPENLAPFICEPASTKRNVRCHLYFVNDMTLLCSEIVSDCSNPIYFTPEIAVYRTQHGEIRFIYFTGEKTPYAVSVEKEESVINIYYRKDIENLLFIDPVFWAPFALERQLIRNESLILHCSCLCFEQKAILFSGPSGIGKSTQAYLWETYKESFQVNGDRCLLHREEGTWYAYGFPVCGSSGICLNQRLPVCAIVLLDQAEQNQISVPDEFEAFKLLFSQITINTWNPDFTAEAFDLAALLQKQIPVLKYACNVSEDAVNMLEDAIRQVKKH